MADNDNQNELRWAHLMEKIEAIAESIAKIEKRIDKEHERIDKERDAICDRLRDVEMDGALLKQRVYFISGGISGVVGAAIAGAAKLLG